LNGRIRLVRVIALVSYFALLVTVVAGVAVLAPPEHVPKSLVLLAFGVPLLVPLRGLLHARPYTHAWCSLLSLFYLTLGIYQAATPGSGRSVGITESLLATALFVSCMLFARWRSRELRAAAEPRADA
jgi:uncharacterized membrane protein